MKKIKIFHDADIAKLEADINDWLREHKEIHIIATNMDAPPAGGHSFYILYNPVNMEEERIVETLAVMENVNDPNSPLVKVVGDKDMGIKNMS